MPADSPEFPSLSAELPAVNWQEREIQDWFGLKAVGHPNPRRVALHDNWPDVYPLRKDFPLETVLPPFEGERHIYRPALGEGVFQVPVGPVHAGIIEPGHFNFAVAGEPILYLQLRMFYTHKGTEKLFEKLPIHKAVFLAESISGDSSFSHGTAFCQAIERAASIEVPLRGLVDADHPAGAGANLQSCRRHRRHRDRCRLRHRECPCQPPEGDVGHLERAVDWQPPLARHGLRRRRAQGLGRRRNWTRCATQLDSFAREFQDLISLIDSSESTRDRLEQTGVLRPDKARDLGIVGVGGRASGVDLDVRRDHPYAAYSRYSFRVPVYQAGDVWHRMQVRIDEVNESIGIVRKAMADGLQREFRVPVPAIPSDRCALSAVEGWRGEIIHWIRTGPDNHLRTLQDQRPLAQQLASAGRSGPGKHHCGFSGDQQELQSFLLGDGPVNDVQDSSKDGQHGHRHRQLSGRAGSRSPIAFADVRASISTNGRTRDPRPRCVQPARSPCRDKGDSRKVTVDYGLCVFCGLCAEASSDQAVRITQEFELATSDRRNLVLTAEYTLNADGTHRAVAQS